MKNDGFDEFLLIWKRIDNIVRGSVYMFIILLKEEGGTGKRWALEASVKVCIWKWFFIPMADTSINDARSMWIAIFTFYIFQSQFNINIH